LKKAIIFLLTGAVTLVTLCLLPFTAFAAEAESVSIPVEIEGGGTAEIISEVNCPLPKESSLEVQDGATENINISFSVPGDYEYTIQAETKEGLYYSPEYYTATVAVRADNSGKLTSTVILTKAGSNYKLDRCRFVIAEKQSDESEANAVTQPADTEQSAGTAQTPKNPPTSRPQTGDDSMLDIYLLICIAAAGGLFMLSVIYSVSTERLIGRK
jgi:pilin isopeptide linkage protein